MGATMAFATLTLARLFHGFTCRSERSLVDLKFSTNLWSIGAFAAGTLLLAAVLFLPGLQILFEVTPLSGIEYATILGLAITPTIFVQGYKFITSKKRKNLLVFSAGINLFIVPANLYNGGVLGISQVIRTVLVRYFHLASGTTDIAGIINMLLNIPLFVLAYVFVGKKFFFRTLVCVVSQTLFLSLIPIPAIPIVRDSLTASIIGGIFGGTGIGIALQSGGSSGGLDIVGMIFTKRFKGFSVGKVSLSVNAVIYIVCAVLFGLQTAVYSIIYSAVSMLMTDRAHTQNINTEVVIFTKKKPLKIIDYIVNEYHRDATWWEAKGGYTEENTYMVIVVLSKYECAHLKRELKEVDEHAFVIVKDGMSVVGKYEKHLQG